MLIWTPDCSIQIASAEPRAVPAARRSKRGQHPAVGLFHQVRSPWSADLFGRRRDLVEARVQLALRQVAGQLRHGEVQAEDDADADHEHGEEKNA